MQKLIHNLSLEKKLLAGSVICLAYFVLLYVVYVMDWQFELFEALAQFISIPFIFLTVGIVGASSYFLVKKQYEQYPIYLITALIISLVTAVLIFTVK